MVEVVAGHRFDNRAEGHVAAFGVDALLRHALWRRVLNQRKIPFAHRRERAERAARAEAAVHPRPFLLVERLNDVVRLGEGLPQTERERDFAVGEMAEDLARVPLA